MTAKRWDGTAYQDILTTKKRWNGTSWVDLTVAKRWDGAAWQDIPGLFGGALSASTSPAVVEGFVDILEPAPPVTAVTSSACTATASGGTGPYTYAWTYVSGSSAISADSPTGASTTFTANVSKNGSKSAVWKVTVTDSLSATASANVSIDLYYTTGV